MNKIKSIINHIEEMAIGLGVWICTALFIIFLRDFFENMLSFNSIDKIAAFHFVHVPIFFISSFLAIIILLHLFSKEEITKVSRISLAFFIIILFPLLVDYCTHLISKGDISYLYIYKNLKVNFFNFLNLFVKLPDVSYGMRLEIMSISILSSLYIYIKRENIFLSLLGGFFVFLVCFFYIALPGILIATFRFFSQFIHFLGTRNTSISVIFLEGELAQRRGTIIELVITLLLATIWFLRYNFNKFNAALRNLRFPSVLHYILLLIGGFAFYLYFNYHFVGLLDKLSFIKMLGTILAIFFAFQFSVIMNDIYDIECDKISNKSRPLVLGIFSKEEYLKLGLVYLTFSLLFAFGVGDTAFMLTLVFVSLYFIYSAPPLRLKRFFPISNIIIGIQAVIVFFLGYLFSEGSPTSIIIPVISFAKPLFFVFLLSSSVKDLKDIEGDKASGIHTLAVFLGEDRAKKVIGFLVYLSYLSTPFFLNWFFNFTIIFMLALIFGLFSYFYIKKKYAKEKVIFYIYFTYVILIIILLCYRISTQIPYRTYN